MLVKSLILISIIFNIVGLHSISTNIDQAVIRKETGNSRVASASEFSFSLPEILPRPKVYKGAFSPNILAQNYILFDPDSSTIFAQQNIHKKVPIASTTKIMTALVALENYKLDDIITVSNKAANQIGADALLMPGEKITVENVLNCMLIKSGNDAAYAIAEHMNDSTDTGISKFLEAMNNKALELGMKDTKYMDPAGLDTTGYSSAYDLSLVTKKALENETFASIVKKDKASVSDITHTIWHTVKNSNRLVGEFNYPGAIGVKTGYMPEAGHCLVAAAVRNNHTLISVVLNTNLNTATASAIESRKLLDWGYENIDWGDYN